MALHCAPSVPQTKKKSRLQAWKYQNFAVPIWGSFFDAEERDAEMQQGVSSWASFWDPWAQKA